MRENEVWIDVGNECGFPYVRPESGTRGTTMREKDKKKTERHLSLRSQLSLVLCHF